MNHNRRAFFGAALYSVAATLIGLSILYFLFRIGQFTFNSVACFFVVYVGYALFKTAKSAYA